LKRPDDRKRRARDEKGDSRDIGYRSVVLGC